MEKMEILNTKLTAINDEIRELSGSEGTLGLDAMADKVRGGNDEIAVQTQLLEQAYAELQGKVDPELYENGYAEGYAKGDTDGQQKGYDKALAEGYIKPSGTLEITENNKEYDVSSYEKANVAVAVENKLAQVMNKTITEVTEEDFGGATEIKQYAFCDCKSLNNVTIPDNITSIRNNAFDGCSSLTSITIPDGVTSIGSSAFSNTKIISITIPSSITTMMGSVFYNCSKLTEVHITDLTSWCNISFTNNNSSGLYYANKLYLNGNLMTDLVIPDDVTSIKNYVFSYVKTLTNVTIPNSVTSIGNDAFYSCELIEIATIGSGIKSIGSQAFHYCKALKSVTVKATTPPTIQSNTFNSVPTDCAFYVPAESVEAYKTATNWSARADYIFPIEEE